VKAYNAYGDSEFSNPDQGWSPPFSYWVYSHQITGTENNAYISEALGLFGGMWSTYGYWMCDFRLSGSASIRGDSEYGLYKATMTYSTDPDGGGTNRIWSNPDDEYLGSVPELSGDSADYSFVATAMADYTINSINSIPGVGFIWTTVQLIANLLNIYDDHSSWNQNYEEMRAWNYSLDTKDAYQWFCVYVDIPPDTVAHFHQDYDIEYIDNMQVKHIHLGQYVIWVDTTGMLETSLWIIGIPVCVTRRQKEIRDEEILSTN
jgi:hypothetical protein